MATLSGTSSSIPMSFKYDVFLSFRGEDTRKNFVDHLYDALERQGIHTYKDDEKIKQGERIDNQLKKSIEDSKLFIIVFSKNYASSSWCLDELVKIIECQKAIDQIAYPVFYDVEPTEVRKQSGEVEKAFAEHINKEAAGKWREALKQAAGLAGWELKNTANGHEAKVIKVIVEQISLEIRSSNVYVDKNIIGMGHRKEKVISSLETGSGDVCIIGIKGIGGGGKTTLARAIFDQISIQFEGKSFVENIREVSKASTSGLMSLQKQVLSDVLNDQGITISGIHEGKAMMRKMLCSRKVLVVLDDVDHKEQLDALAAEPSWFKAGSTIIITTRDEQVLEAHGVKQIHKVELLTNKEATRLFTSCAFTRGIPSSEYSMLSTQVVRYAAGLPLTIRVLGAFLCGKDKTEWIAALKRLEDIPLKETLDKLEVSYESLEDDYKEIFLDVACFLKWFHKEDAIRMLESCGFHARIALSVLEKKCLITISNDEYLGMHDSIQEMGRNIVRRKKKPNRHSRLWIHEEIEDILADDSETEATVAIAVQNSLVELDSEFVTKGFGKMKELRFLHVVSKSEDDNSHCNEKIDHVSHSLPSALQYLSWEFYPYQSLPKTFRANKLVTLEMCDGRIVQLWEEGKRKELKKLRFLNLKHSQLRKIDLGLTPSLERLNLEDCYNLVELELPRSSVTLEKLAYLNLSGCSGITSFSFIKKLESLQVLCLKRLDLREFPDIIPEHCNNELQELRFRHNDIEELPSSIANLRELVYLDLHSCRNLRSLPRSICSLQNLKKLKLNGCSLEKLPEDIDRLKCLEKLNLSFTRIKHLPDSICMLKLLKTLDLSTCWNLEKLPEDLGHMEGLESLIVTNCRLIRKIPNSICELQLLKNLNLMGCIQLKQLPMELGQLRSLEEINVKDTGIWKLPWNISSLTGLKIYKDKPVYQSRGY